MTKANYLPARSPNVQQSHPASDAPAIVGRLPRNLSREGAVKYLAEVHGINVRPSTMARWFCRGGGPPARLAGGRKPLYPVRELDAWAERYLGPLCSRSSGGRAKGNHR